VHELNIKGVNVRPLLSDVIRAAAAVCFMLVRTSDARKWGCVESAQLIRALKIPQTVAWPLRLAVAWFQRTSRLSSVLNAAYFKSSAEWWIHHSHDST